jgi:transposase
MFIKANKTKKGGKDYTNYLLVESLHTERGPRHKVIASLGNLKPAPAEYWYQLAKKVESALAGQLSLLDDSEVKQIVDKVGNRKPTQDEKTAQTADSDRAEQIDVDGVRVEEAREGGPAHVGHQMWLKLGMNEILDKLDFNERERSLTELLVLSRLITPGSELATRDWVPRTALPDILGSENCELGWRTLYTHLDKLHGLRSTIENALAEREKTLLNLDDSILLYDLTSTYFEGQCASNDQAQRGYSRDHRPDCKQVVVGLVLNRDRFPVAHEIFDGNTIDTTTVDQMLDVLDARAGGKRNGRTVVVDRGMSSKENLATIRSRGCHYMVATRQSERDAYLAEIEDSEGWFTFEKLRHGKYWDTVLNRISIKRVSGTAAEKVKEKRLKTAQQKFERAQKAADLAQDKGEDANGTLMKSLKAVELNIDLKYAEQESAHQECLIICVSEGRVEKDRAIREKQEKKFLTDAAALKTRVAAGKLKSNKVHENIGRLKERYSRVARYYDLVFDDTTNEFSYTENKAKKELAKELDGSYIIRTDRTDLTDQEIWQTYMLLTRVESAFRDMKTPLLERPIFHQLERRVQTHIFICLLAYHLLALVEKLFRDKGIATSWETIREKLRTHQVTTIVMPYQSSKKILRVRRGTTPEKPHIEIYDTLGIPHEPMQPRKSWSESATPIAKSEM